VAQLRGRRARGGALGTATASEIATARRTRSPARRTCFGRTVRRLPTRAGSAPATPQLVRRRRSRLRGSLPRRRRGQPGRRASGPPGRRLGDCGLPAARGRRRAGRSQAGGREADVPGGGRRAGCLGDGRRPSARAGRRADLQRRHLGAPSLQPARFRSRSRAATPAATTSRPISCSRPARPSATGTIRPVGRCATWPGLRAAAARGARPACQLKPCEALDRLPRVRAPRLAGHVLGRLPGACALLGWPRARGSGAWVARARGSWAFAALGDGDRAEVERAAGRARSATLPSRRDRAGGSAVGPTALAARAAATEKASDDDRASHDRYERSPAGRKQTTAGQTGSPGSAPGGRGSPREPYAQADPASGRTVPVRGWAARSHAHVGSARGAALARRCRLAVRVTPAGGKRSPVRACRVRPAWRFRSGSRPPCATAPGQAPGKRLTRPRPSSCQKPAAGHDHGALRERDRSAIDGCPAAGVAGSRCSPRGGEPHRVDPASGPRLGGLRGSIRRTRDAASRCVGGFGHAAVVRRGCGAYDRYITWGGVFR
jgi:hypothetical protein